MRIDSMTLVNFRNYDNLDINFSPSLNIIHGLNGSGKTNLVEAIYLLSLTKSFRISNDKVMIKKGAMKAKVRGEVRKFDDLSTYSVEVSSLGKTVVVDNSRIDKISDYISRINVILFNPSNTRIIDMAPNDRRSMINVEISQLYKEYLIVLANYNKVLKQRNFYLRGMYVNGNYQSAYLDILTKKLVEYGRVICKYRTNFVDNINKYITDIYGSIFGSGVMKLKYVSIFKGKDSEALIKRYEKNYQKEMSIGKTLEGIHHDDIEFVLDNNNLKEWGSEGQRKNAVISFKLAEIKVIKDIKGYYPILILDDLFSELDKEKIANLLNILDSEVQTFITTTDLNNAPDEVKSKARKFLVNGGNVEEEI